MNKYFIGCKGGDYKIKPFYIMFPKTSGDGETKWMYFLEKNIIREV